MDYTDFTAQVCEVGSEKREIEKRFAEMDGSDELSVRRKDQHDNIQ